MAPRVLTPSSALLRKKKNLKKGIQFTLMVVGPSGSGRSTFINTLCGQQVVETSTTVPAPEDCAKDVSLELRHHNVELEDEEGVRIQLSVIDTPGFAGGLDNSGAFSVIQEYITKQYDDVLLEESRVRRNPRFKDGRIHALIYLIVPTGHGLREIDIELMSNLAQLVNIIPVISKADSLTPPELELEKKIIMQDISHYGIPIYNFPYDRELDDEDTVEANSILRSLLPFALVGSNQIINADGRVVRARVYPWGAIDVEDSDTSDFTPLRNALLISHLQDLKEYTHEVLYERYRTEALSKGPSSTSVGGASSTSLGADSPVISDDYGSLSREDQIRMEEERLKAFEEKIQKDLMLKRQELAAREKELRSITEKLDRDARAKASSDLAVKEEGY